MVSPEGVRYRQQTFIVDKRTKVTPKAKRKQSKRDIETVTSDSDEDDELEIQIDDEVQFTGSSPAKLQQRRVSLRKKGAMGNHDFSQTRPTIKGGSQKRPQAGQPLTPMDPESYPHNVVPPKKKSTNPYGSMAGHDNLSGAVPSSSNTLQPPARRQHPQNDSNGARQSSAMPIFARQKAATALALDVLDADYSRKEGRPPPRAGGSSKSANVQATSTRKPQSSNSSTQASTRSYLPRQTAISIKGRTDGLNKGKGKSPAIEIDDDSNDDEIDDADGFDNQPSTSKVRQNNSAQKVCKPGHVSGARSQYEPERATQVHSSPAHGATDQEDDMAIPLQKTAKGKLVANMQAKSARSDQMGLLPKAVKNPDLQKHLTIKSLVSEAGSQTNLRLIIDKSRFVLATSNSDKIVHFVRRDLFAIELSNSSPANLKQDRIAFAVLQIGNNEMLRALGVDENADLKFFMEFDKEHDWDDTVYAQLFEMLKSQNTSGTPTVEYIRCEAFKSQQQQSLLLLRHKGPIKSNLPAQHNMQDLSLSGQAAQARRDVSARKKEEPASSQSIAAPRRTEKPLQNNTKNYVDLSDEEDKRPEALSSDDDLKVPAPRSTRLSKKDSSRETSREAPTRPGPSRPKARPSVGARQRDLERNGDDSDSVTVAASRVIKRKKPQDDIAIEGSEFYESKSGRGSKSKDAAAFVSTAKATTDGASRVTRQQGDREETRSTSAPISKPKEKWNPISEGPDDEVVLVYPPEGSGSISITKGDFDRLQPDEYLNDTLVEFGMKQVWEKLANSADAAEQELATQIHIFSSFFYKKLSAKSASKDKNKTPIDAYTTVRKWTAKFDLFSKKYVFLPINENFHWYLAVIINPGAVLRRPSEPVDQDPDSNRQPSASLNAEIDSREQDGRARVTSPYFAKGRTETANSEKAADAPADAHNTEMEIDAPVGSAAKTQSETSEVSKAKAGIEHDEQPQPDAQKDRAISEANITEGTVADTATSVGTVTRAAEADDDDMCYIITLDSLGSKHKPVHDKLRTYLKREAVDKKKAIDEDHVYVGPSNVTAINGSCSEQHNFSDCGLYVMHFTEKLLESREDIVPFLTKKKIPRTATNQQPKGPSQTQEMINELWARAEAMTRRDTLANDIRMLCHKWQARRDALMDEKMAKRQARLKAGEGQSGTEGEGVKAADEFTSTSEEESGDSDVEIVEKAKTPSPAKRKKGKKRRILPNSDSSEGESAGENIKVPRPSQPRQQPPTAPKTKTDTSNIVVEVFTTRSDASSIPKPSLSQQQAKSEPHRSNSPVKAEGAAALSIDLDNEPDELESSPAPVPTPEIAMDIDDPHPLLVETSRMSLETEPSESEGVEEEEDEEEEEEEEESRPGQPELPQARNLREVSRPAETSATTVSTSTSTSHSGSASSSTSDDDQDATALTDGDSSAFIFQKLSPQPAQAQSRSHSPSRSAKKSPLSETRGKPPSLSQPSQSPSSLRKLVDELATYMPSSSSSDEEVQPGLSSVLSKVSEDRKAQKRARISSTDANADIDTLINIEAPSRKRSRKEPDSLDFLTFADNPTNNRQPSTSPAPRLPPTSTSSSSPPQTFHTPNGGNKDQPIDIGDSEDDTARPSFSDSTSSHTKSKLKGETSQSLLASVGKVAPGFSGELKRPSQASSAIFNSQQPRSKFAQNGTLKSPTHTRFLD